MGHWKHAISHEFGFIKNILMTGKAIALSKDVLFDYKTRLSNHEKAL